ncbi:glycosyl-phosphatidylinositol-anchored molecule-like protein isoform 2-T2 [Thomomys bottae]
MRGQATMERVTLLAVLLAVGLPLGRAVVCHVCELENSFSCLNPRNCTVGESNCMIVAMKIFPRFYIVSKQCVSACPVMELDLILTTAQAGRAMYKVYTIDHPMPFLYIRCCTEDLCNEDGPAASIVATYREQTGGASQEGHHHPWLPTLWGLHAASVFADLV